MTTSKFKRVTRSREHSRQPLLHPLDKTDLNGQHWKKLQQHKQLTPIPFLLLVNMMVMVYFCVMGLFGFQRRPRFGTAADNHCTLWCPGGPREIVMFSYFQRVFVIDGAAKLVRRFLGSCLLCQHTKGEKIIPRRWGELYRTDTRNEGLQFDFLFLGEGLGTWKYLLVMKDSFCHFCELVSCHTPASEVATKGPLAWHSRFGIPVVWISDTNSHFKNQIVAELSRQLKCQQPFVVAYY
ncbi:LOW QUALITY PROTEIN: Retrotransposon protein [Phytophthora megakarya]|uniref:Retrotransposon protein n=1 Tax=Phytophthora megakarya TaxID=4795 RepID=A0A225VS30_9STRA|nr:LOW QUALITY PROTEIN: Retrotransposon protein [Phytophthora megakarya]